MRTEKLQRAQKANTGVLCEQTRSNLMLHTTYLEFCVSKQDKEVFATELQRFEAMLTKQPQSGTTLSQNSTVRSKQPRNEGEITEIQRTGKYSKCNMWW